MRHAFNTGRRLGRIWCPDVPPESPSDLDDEFRGMSGGLPRGWAEFDPNSRLTVVEGDGGVALQKPSASQTGRSLGIYKTIPAGDFTIWTKLALGCISQQDYVTTGLMLWQDATDTANGDLQSFHSVIFAGAPLIGSNHFTSDGTYSSTPISMQLTAAYLVSPTVYLRLRRTGTTYGFDFSLDGVGWLRVYSGTILVTPTHFGLFASDQCPTAYTVRFPFFRYLPRDTGYEELPRGGYL